MTNQHEITKRMPLLNREGNLTEPGLGARPALGLSPAGHPGERDADQGMGLLFRVQWAYRSRADDCGQRVYGTRFGLVSRF